MPDGLKSRASESAPTLTGQGLVDYRPYLLNLCLLRFGFITQDAEDAVAETLARALGALDQFKGESLAKTWLTRIAMNVCKDMRKSAWRRRVVTTSDEQLVKALEAADRGIAGVAHEEAVAEIERLVAKYGKDVELLLAIKRGEATYESIAKDEGVAPSTVETRLARLRSRIRKERGFA